jgi:hypothetical protein
MSIFLEVGLLNALVSMRSNLPRPTKMLALTLLGNLIVGHRLGDAKG